MQTRPIVLPFVGAGMMVETASTNTVLQTIVEERMRGRVMAFYTMAFLGTAPIGSLLAGLLAARIGAPMTVLLGGVAVHRRRGMVHARAALAPRAAPPDLYRARNHCFAAVTCLMKSTAS